MTGQVPANARPRETTEAAEWVAAGRALAEAATPGPYGVFDRGVGFYVTVRGDPESTFPEGWRADLGRREDAEAIAGALNRLPLALAALDAVLALHRPERHGEEDWCADCDRDWPCATVEAITAALAGGGS